MKIKNPPTKNLNNKGFRRRDSNPHVLWTAIRKIAVSAISPLRDKLSAPRKE